MIGKSLYTYCGIWIGKICSSTESGICVMKNCGITSDCLGKIRRRGCALGISDCQVSSNMDCSIGGSKLLRVSRVKGAAAPGIISMGKSLVELGRICSSSNSSCCIGSEVSIGSAKIERHVL